MATFPPFRWLRAVEDKIFWLASEAEYRLKITPRNTKIVPSTFDRRIVRTFVLFLPMLVATIFVDGRPLRAKVLFAMLVLVAIVLAAIFVADAMPGQPPSGRPLPRPPMKPSAKTPIQPSVKPPIRPSTASPPSPGRNSPPRPPVSRSGPTPPRRP